MPGARPCHPSDLWSPARAACMHNHAGQAGTVSAVVRAARCAHTTRELTTAVAASCVPNTTGCMHAVRLLHVSGSTQQLQQQPGRKQTPRLQSTVRKYQAQTLLYLGSASYRMHFLYSHTHSVTNKHPPQPHPNSTTLPTPHQLPARECRCLCCPPYPARLRRSGWKWAGITC